MTINWVPKKHVDTNIVNNLINTSLINNHFANYGPNVELLEYTLRNKLMIDETKSVIVVSNGSVAIQVLASAIEHHNGISLHWATQSFTFPPSCQGALSHSKIVDIDIDGGLNLDDLDSNINGIVVTNIFGNVVDISKYEKWQSECNNRYIIFDNAATPYTFYNGKSSCNYGTGATISFHHTKPIGFGEGGAIIVDKKYENTIRCLCNFGIGLSSEYFVRNGNNYKMSDVSAIYILQYLNNFDHIYETHRKLYAYFKEKICCFPHVKLFPSFHDKNFIVPSCFCILVDIDSEKVISNLQIQQIYCRKYYHPLMSTTNAMKIYNSIICIPCTVDMDYTDVDTILRILNE
jgi:dTDP-4-amino-4,6-dideoxygalactose transaminase